MQNVKLVQTAANLYIYTHAYVLIYIVLPKISELDI